MATEYDWVMLRELERLQAAELMDKVLMNPEVARPLLVQVPPPSLIEVEAIQVNVVAIEDLSGEMVDRVLDEVDSLMAKGRFKEAFARFTSGIARIFQSLVGNKLSLEKLTERIDKFRDTGGKLAKRLGAKGFTIEFSLSIAPSLTLGLHFDAPA